MSDFARTLIGEGIEQRFHEVVERTFREAADQGNSGKTIFSRVLKAVAKPNGLVMTFARTMPGFSLPVMGAAIAYILERSRIVDALLPGDSRSAVRHARALLKTASGSAIIGALSGIRDAAVMDTAETDRAIDRAIDEIISEPGTPDEELTLEWDKVAVTYLMPDRAFPVARDGGSIRYGSDGVPVVNSADWARYKAMWDSTHKPTTKQVSGGKGKKSTTQVVPAEHFPFQLLRFEDAVAQGCFDQATPADLDAIRAMMPSKPVEWWDEVGREVRRMFLLISRSVRQGTALQYAMREDHIEDVIGKKGIPFLKDLAAFYNPRATADNRLTPEDLEDLIAAFDVALGSELTSWNKLQRRVSQIWSGRGSLSAFAKACLYSIFGLVVFFNLASVALFLTAIVGIIVGAFMPYEGPWSFFGTVYAQPNWLAAGLMFVGGIVITVMLFPLRIWQRVLAPFFVGILRAPSEYLAEFGWRFTFALLPLFAFVIGALLMESSITVRVVIVTLVCMGISGGMGRKVARQFASAELLTFRAARYEGIVIIAILALDWVIRNAPFSMIGNWIVDKVGQVSPYFNNQWVASFVLFWALFIPLLLLVRWVYRLKSEGAINRFVLQQRHGFATFLVFIVFITAAAIAVAVPWFASTRREFDPLGPSKPAAASTTAPAAPTSPATVIIPQFTTAPARTRTHSRARTRTPVGELDCNRLSPPGKVAYGCP